MTTEPGSRKTLANQARKADSSIVQSKGVSISSYKPEEPDTKKFGEIPHRP
jgi:hypothetical protein